MVVISKMAPNSPIADGSGMQVDTVMT